VRDASHWQFQRLCDLVKGQARLIVVTAAVRAARRVMIRSCGVLFAANVSVKLPDVARLSRLFPIY
jgi:hypothetical protein